MEENGEAEEPARHQLEPDSGRDCPEQAAAVCPGVGRGPSRLGRDPTPRRGRGRWA